MNTFKKTLVCMLLCFGLTTLKAQSDIKEYSISEGQVFDIIFLTNRQEPEVKSLLQDYFKRAFPIAEANGYHSLGGYGISENTDGNYLPSTMVFGYWDTLDGREKFLEAVDIKMPDFHEMRRKIWSTFDLTYYESKQDLSFNIDKSKFNTVSAYWEKEGSDCESFKKSWVETANKNGGLTKVQFDDGQSPYGYHYNPDILMITEWDSKEAFDKFQEQVSELDHGTIEHVNQFVLK